MDAHAHKMPRTLLVALWMFVLMVTGLDIYLTLKYAHEFVFWESNIVMVSLYMVAGIECVVLTRLLTVLLAFVTIQMAYRLRVYGTLIVTSVHAALFPFLVAALM